MPSSVIQIMFFDPQAGIVDVVFRARHATYRYFEVSRAEWDGFLAADSKGTYLNQVFKARHRDRKLARGEGMNRRTPGVEWWPRAVASAERGGGQNGDPSLCSG